MLKKVCHILAFAIFDYLGDIDVCSDLRCLPAQLFFWNGAS
jgi:hypothetical protein